MKKLAKIFLCLTLALMMSLSLMVPAFAAGTCNHSFKRVIVGTYVWYDNIYGASVEQRRFTAVLQMRNKSRSCSKLHTFEWTS